MQQDFSEISGGYMRNIISIFMVMATVALTSFSVNAAPVVELIKSGSRGLEKLISKTGISSGSDAAIQLQTSLELTLKAFNRGKVPASSNEIKKAFMFDHRIMTLLSKDSEEFSQKDLVKLVNRLSVQAEKRARGPFMMCGACVTDELSQLGVVAISQKVSKNTSRILRRAPRNAKELNLNIKRMGGVLNIPHMDVVINNIPDVDKRRFFVALSKMSAGGPKEKALGQALRNFNNVGSKSYFHTNRLYTLMTDELGSADMTYWTNVLNKISKEKPIDPERGRVANLENWFIKQADQDPSLREPLEKLKKKNCWKIFR
jgi:hypothetical protein